jgi:FkbM family methyltransferase
MAVFKKIIQLCSKYLSKDGRILQALKRKPRFVPGKIKLNNFIWQYCDAPSFAWQYDEIFKRGIYKFLSDKAAPRIIDCGANVGTGVVYFSNLFRNAHITGFEPDTTVFECLKLNCSTLKNPRIDLQNKAVYSHSGHLKFSSQGADGGKVSEAGNAVVECVRLKDYLNEPIDFLKIDIEGAETEVINDCAEQLKNVKAVFIEYHGTEQGPDSLHEILTHLSNAGLHYVVESVTIQHEQPFVKRNNFAGFHNLVNIYAQRF